MLWGCSAVSGTGTLHEVYQWTHQRRQKAIYKAFKITSNYLQTSVKIDIIGCSNRSVIPKHPLHLVQEQIYKKVYLYTQFLFVLKLCVVLLFCPQKRMLQNNTIII